MLYEVITPVEGESRKSPSLLSEMKSARDRKFDRPYTELVYQPMLELMGYLRANGFKTFIRITSYNVCYTKLLRPWRAGTR